MTIDRKLSRMAALLLSLAMLSVLGVRAQQAPQQINFQGRLTDAAGNPLNASKSMTFKIFNAATGGNMLWSETQTVSVSSGIYNVSLGAVTAIPGNAFSGPNTWLEITVSLDPAMTPRLPLVAVPYAMVASSANWAANLSGSTGFIVKVATSGVGALSNSVIFESSGNIGINTSGPASKLTVAGGDIQLSTGGTNSGVVFGDNSRQLAAAPFTHVAMITSGTSWTVPSGVTRVWIEVYGGGGGGGGASNNNCAGGGGAAGGVAMGFVDLAGNCSGSCALSIGAGGSGVLGSTGTTGGSSYFVSAGILAAGGGSAGGGGISSGGVLGGSSVTGAGADSAISLQGGAGAAVPCGAFPGGIGGSNMRGGGGAAGLVSFNGSNGGVCGGGGGGGGSGGGGTTSGGGGGGGCVIIWY